MPLLIARKKAKQIAFFITYQSYSCSVTHLCTKKYFEGLIRSKCYIMLHFIMDQKYTYMPIMSLRKKFLKRFLNKFPSVYDSNYPLRSGTLNKSIKCKASKKYSLARKKFKKNPTFRKKNKKK